MRHTLILTLLSIVFFSFFAACTDELAGLEEQSASSREARQEKLRHADLMDRAVRGAGKNGRSIGLIFKLDTQSILERYGTLDRYAVLERYATLERYNVLERYEYRHVFDGFAIWADADSVDGLIDEMVADPDIDWVEPDVSVRVEAAPGAPVNDPGAGETVPWGVARIGAYDLGVTGLKDVAVFVIDTGIDNPEVALDDEYDFTMDVERKDGIDTDGHGTHLSGVIGAKDDGAGIVGVAPGVGLHSLRVITGDEVQDNEALDLSTAVAAVERVTAFKLTNPNTPVVVNLSLGSDIGTTTYNALDDAIAASTGTGVTYVIAAGNQGIDAGTVSPAHVEEAITVGAYDEADRFADFSNYGPLVDILAPGTNILSLQPDAMATGDGHMLMSGTSQATAHVTGVVALFLAQNPYASPEQVRSALLTSGKGGITGVPAGTTDLTVYAGIDGGMVAMEVPPFLNYAITAGGDLDVMGTLTVAYDGAAPYNASILTNHNLKLRHDGNLVQGFGYYAGAIDRKRAETCFQPVVNPTGLTGYRKVGKGAKAEVPAFDAQAYEYLSTQYTSGDLNLSGHYDLGTEDDPVIWYVSGKLMTNGDVSFSGYGIFVVEKGVEIRNDVAMSDETSNVAIYASETIKVTKSGAKDLSGHWLSGKDIDIDGDLTLRGSLTAAGVVKIRDKRSVTIYFRPVDSSLTEPLWPMNTL